MPRRIPYGPQVGQGRPSKFQEWSYFRCVRWKYPKGSDEDNDLDKLGLEDN